MKLLLSPHDDDAHLFCCFTAIRERPLIVVMTDSWIQPLRGESGCSARDRALETEAASAHTHCAVARLSIRDDQATFDAFVRTLQYFASSATEVYAPAFQGGNIHHDMTHDAALEVFGADKVICYTTYTKTELYTTGRIEVVPTKEELQIKTEALSYYQSQARINMPHFRAVAGKSEWFL